MQIMLIRVVWRMNRSPWHVYHLENIIILHSDLNTFLSIFSYFSGDHFCIRGKECACIFGNTSGLCWMKRMGLWSWEKSLVIIASLAVSCLSLVFLVSRCFKNTHHMSFSPDVMHIFCQSPRLHSSPFFSLLHLDHCFCMTLQQYTR